MSWEHAFDTDTEPIRVFAIDFLPSCEAGLVSDGHRTRIELTGLPHLGMWTVEAITKASRVAGRVAEHEPDDLGVRIGGGAFDGFPDDIGDGGGFVEDDQQALAAVVHTGERFGVGLRPRDHINAPRALAR